MTLEEFARQNNLAINKEKDKLVVVPVGRFRYDSFPAGRFAEDPVTGAFVEVPIEGSVEITLEEFENLRSHNVSWEDGKLVPYTMSDELVACQELLSAYYQKKNELTNAQLWLSSKDYVGIKIAHVALIGTQEDIDALKTEYADVIKEANEKRAIVNSCNDWIVENRTKVYEAETALNKEFEIG